MITQHLPSGTHLEILSVSLQSPSCQHILGDVFAVLQCHGLSVEGFVLPSSTTREVRFCVFHIYVIDSLSG